MEVGDRLGSPGPDDRAAVLGGEEAGVPILHAVGAVAPVIGEDDERGEIVIERAERGADPAASAGESRENESG